MTAGSTPTTTVTVSAGTGRVTVVDVFTVDPTQQSELACSLAKTTDHMFVAVPG